MVLNKPTLFPSRSPHSSVPVVLFSSPLAAQHAIAYFFIVIPRPFNKFPVHHVPSLLQGMPGAS